MSNSKDPSSKSKDIHLSEGIILGLASACAYLFAFVYEYGFASHFNIPVRFIRVSLESLLVYGVVIIALTLFFFPYANVIKLLMPRNIHPEIQMRLNPIISSLFFTFVVAVLYGFSNWKFWVILFAINAIPALVFFVFPVFAHRNIKGYLNKLIAQGKIDDQSPGYITLAAQNYSGKMLTGVQILLLGLSLSWSVGNAVATRQTSFLVKSTSPEMVVLQIYGDTIICAPFDRNTKEIQTSFVIMNVENESDTIFTVENIGPLKVAQQQVKISPSTFPTSTHPPSIIPSETLITTTAVPQKTTKEPTSTSTVKP